LPIPCSLAESAAIALPENPSIEGTPFAVYRSDGIQIAINRHPTMVAPKSVQRLEEMPKASKLKSPDQIDPFDTDRKTLRVVIETPKGSRNKFKYDPELGSYALSSVLGEGMVFPYDFGFVPQTKDEDGDPTDVLLLMDQPAFTGCVVEARIVGVIQANQTEKGKTIRNDRVLAVASHSHDHADIKEPKDLNSNMIDELEKFFVAYNKARDRKFKILGCKDARTAIKLIKKTRVK
jgi:inorganic pyrophosphatase